MELGTILSSVYFNAMIADQLRKQLDEYNTMRRSGGNSERLSECITAAADRLIEANIELTIWKSQLHAENECVQKFVDAVNNLSIETRGAMVSPAKILEIWNQFNK